MKTTIALDASNRIVLSRELRRAAGIPRRQKLLVSATPGRIVLEMEANTSGRIIKRGKLKVWTGEVPTIPIEEAVKQSRHYPASLDRKQSVKRKTQKPANDFVLRVGRALRRAGRVARKTARMHGTPVYIWRDGKIVA